MQKTFGDRQPMRDDAGIGPGVTVRRDLLWIEKVEVRIANGLGYRVEACGQGLPGVSVKSA